MRNILISIIVYFFIGQLNAQQDQYIFQAVKYKLLDYGQQKNSAAEAPIRIILNLRESTIHLETANTDIMDYTGFQHQFSIEGNIAALRGVQVYGTREGFIFTINPKRRTIVISKGEVRPQFQSLWLEEIEIL